MVHPLGPGKFYGSSLPRPRFYAGDRVDPPPPVNDALISWAIDAHWSMGGLSLTRHRLQGRIEGNVERLRAQIEKQDEIKAEKEAVTNKLKVKKKGGKIAKGKTTGKKASERKEVHDTPSPPPAPVALKRRRVVGLVEDDGEEEVSAKRSLVRKLGDDFERVARESGMVARDEDQSVAGRTRGKREAVDQAKAKAVVKRKLVKAADVTPTRSSPRLAAK